MSDNKQIANDSDYIEVDPEDLLQGLASAIKDDNKKDFADIINLAGSTNREIYLASVEEGVGASIDGYIRFWNEIDDKHNIPIAERKPIKLYINSYGGDLLEAFIMIDAIKMSKTPVWTIAQGAVYSAGFFTFICGHKRIAYPHASFLFHEGSASNGGTSSQFENFSAFYKKQLGQLRDVVLDNTKITSDKYKEIQKDDIWMTVEEAQELGVVDEVLKEFI